MLVKQVNEGRHEVENEFTRAVVPENRRAIDLMARVFSLRDSFEWRGLGPVPKSALSSRLNSLNLMPKPALVSLSTTCPTTRPASAALFSVAKEPFECKAFGKACTPAHPLGSWFCMSRAKAPAHAAYYSYGRLRK